MPQHLTKQKVDAGVIGNVAYVEAQEDVTNAQFDYIDGVFVYNVAKLNLARAMGHAAEGFPDVLKVP